MIRFLTKMLLDLIVGLLQFKSLSSTVTIYGSARLTPDNKYYQMAFQLGRMLADKNISVITGGGPGIMEAANKGNQSGNNPSYGCNIILPYEQRQNDFLNIAYQTEFFFVRKFFLRHTSVALIAFPGGFGTMDELFESLTLIRTKCAPQMPIILIGSEYWNGLFQYLRDTQMAMGTISEKDIQQMQIIDDLDEVMRIISLLPQFNKEA